MPFRGFDCCAPVLIVEGGSVFHSTVSCLVVALVEKDLVDVKLAWKP